MTIQAKITIFLLLSSLVIVNSYVVPPTINIASFIPNYFFGIPIQQWAQCMRFVQENIKNDPNILPNTTLSVTTFENNAIASIATAQVLNASDQGFEIAFCCATATTTAMATVALSTEKMVSISPLASNSELSNKHKYPYFSRTIPDDFNEADVLIDILEYLYEQSGQKQYLEVGVMGSTAEYSTSSSANFIRKAKDKGMTIKTYQSFLTNSGDFSIEFNALKASGARVFLAILEPQDFNQMIYQVGQYGLVGDHYVWIASSGCAYSSFLYVNGTFNATRSENANGLLGVSLPLANTSHPQYILLQEEWDTLDPEYTNLVGKSPNIYSILIYDSFYFLATSIHNLILEDGFTYDGKLKNHTQFVDVIRRTTFDGITGWISLDSIGNRRANYDVVNYRAGDPIFTTVGHYNYSTGLTLTEDFVFHDGTTQIPDIDIRNPFFYWSCDDGEKRADLTGKTIVIKSPGKSNPSNIDYDYHCDTFIDCANLSDESVDCSSDYTIVFIVFGVIDIVLILIAILFLIFTVIFGIILPRRRVRSASPFFLIITTISCIIGYASIFAWYGKPQAVACGFQPWILGIAILSMISSLCAKNFRIWRIFKSPFDQKVISDLELFVFWIILMIPGIIILVVWTIVATPDAMMREVDGKDHIGCESNGFTGSVGGIIFFFILVAYCGFLLVFGGFLSIVTRNVPSLFNESKLIAYSIYNLVFLSVVVIPVIIVLNGINPFASWIIRTVAIIYAFTATLWLQFVSKIFGVILVDKFRSASIQNVKTMGTMTNTGTSSFSNIKEASGEE